MFQDCIQSVWERSQSNRPEADAARNVRICRCGRTPAADGGVHFELVQAVV